MSTPATLQGRWIIWKAENTSQKNPCQLTGVIALSFFATVFTGMYFTWYCNYVLQQPTWVASLTTIGALVAIAVVLVMPRLVARFEKRQLIAFGAFFTFAAHVWLYFFSSYVGTMVYQIMKGIGIVFMQSNMWSVIPDCADYGEWKNGVAAPGLVYSVMMFILKCTTGVASYVVLFVLKSVGWVGANGMNQTAAAVAGIRTSFIVGPMILCTVLIACTLLLKGVDRANMAKVAAELNARRAQASGTN